MQNPLAPGHARAILTVLLLWLAGLGAAMQYAKIGVPFTTFEAMYPTAGARIGWLLSLVSLIGAVFGMTAGMAVTGFGLRRSLLGAMLLGAAVSFVQAGLSGLGPLLVSRVVEGLSHLVMVIAAPTLIAQLSPPGMRSFFMTLWATFFGVAYALMSWLGMDFIAAYGIPGLFRLHAALLLIVAAALWLLLPAEPRPIGIARPSFRQLVRTQLRAIRSPWISAPGVGWLFYTLTFVSLLAILPSLFPKHLHAFVTGTLPLVSILTSLSLVPLMLGVLTPTTVVMAGFATAALGAMGLLGPLAPTVAATILFFGLGMVQGASFAAVPTLNQSAADRALSNGLMAQTGNLGNLIGTPVLLVVQTQTGRTGLMLTILCSYIMAIICHQWLAGRRARV